MKSILTILLLTCVGINVAQADCNIGSSVFTLDTSVGDFRGVNASAGCFYQGLVGVRGTYMIGAEDETVNGVKVDIDKMYSADIIVNLPLSDSFYPYLTAGNTWVTVKASANGHAATAKEDFTTYGAGLHYDIRESVGCNAEYKDMDGADMYSIGCQAQF